MSSSDDAAAHPRIRVVIAGEVNADGKKVSAGPKQLFDVIHVTGGQYTISYNRVLDSTPIVVATSTDHNNPAIVVVSKVTKSQCEIECFSFLGRGKTDDDPRDKDDKERHESKKDLKFIDSGFSFIIAEIE